MNLRNRMKHLFRMCGHAMNITVHERLDRFEEQFQSATFIDTQTALLQAAIHTTETLNALTSYVHERLDRQAGIHPPETLNALTSETVVETGDYQLCNPEIGLMEFLYSYLPFRKAVDIGANVGEVSETLLHTGYEVFAFEPYPPAYARLVERLGNKKGFHAFPFALGAEDGEAPLHLAEDRSSEKKYGDPSVFNSLRAHPMPDDLVFKETTAVPVRSLKTLHASGAVPADAGLVKIDTEGFDLEVIRGMGEHRYPVVLAEFWDEELPFARSAVYTLEDLVHQMKGRGYLWHLVLYRIWGRTQIAYYANYSRSITNSWGNAVFFNDYSLFAQAQMWCSAALPRTCFNASLPRSGANGGRAQ